MIPDFRTHDVVRFGLAPLYNTFAHVVRALEITADIVATGEHLEFPAAPRGVT